MAQQIIFIGTIADDGTGTNLRVGGDMINDNFTELYAAVALNTAKVTNATHTGEVTGSGVLTITDKAVTLAKMYDMASNSLIYRRTAGVGVPEVNTLAQLATDLGLVGVPLQRYTATFDLGAGVVTQHVSTATAHPYCLIIKDSSGNKIDHLLQIEFVLTGGFWALNIYSSDALLNNEIFMLW